MIIYNIKLTLIWGLVLLGYHLFAKQETFFKVNRLYLLLGLIAGLLLPLLPTISTGEAFVQLPTFELNEVLVNDGFSAVQQPAVTASTDWNRVFLILIKSLFFIGLAYQVIQIMRSFISIQGLKRTGFLKRWNGINVFVVPSFNTPFSFFETIFIPKDIDSTEEKQILLHESIHVKQKHYVDLFLVEMIGILFWWHPLFHFIKKAIQTNHEYLADEACLQEISKKEYAQLLISQITNIQKKHLAHYFINSQLKNRIIMMKKKQSNPVKSWRLGFILLAFPLVLSPILSHADSGLKSITFEDIVISTDTIPPAPPAPPVAPVPPSPSSVAPAPPAPPAPPVVIPNKNNDTKGEIYSVVDDMPRFPGCESVEVYRERTDCSTNKLLDFLANNIQYPEAAKKSGIQGTAVVRLIIEKDGHISGMTVLRSLSPEIEKECSRVVKAMPNWIPGKRNGKKVRMYYSIPLEFTLDTEEK